MDQAGIETIVASSARAATGWAARPRADRAAALIEVADRLDESADALIPIGQRETHLPEARLRGELKRTTFQLRLFAEVVAEGGYLDVRIDTADPDWPMGAPRPDLRRIRVPLGPVVVFAASNFPFAFSVAGGDTASALAAGCSVILKAHEGHPELSAATAEVVRTALDAAGAPPGLFQIVYDRDAGVAVLEHPTVKAGAFTGSIPGGRALFDLANARPEPIPFFGELGSVNPVFVTARADADRGADVARGLIGSFAMGAGQFCTKPGVVLAPSDGSLIGALRGAELPPAAPMLNERIAEGYRATLRGLREHPGVRVLAAGDTPYAADPSPSVLQVEASAFLDDFDALSRECFGPTVLVVGYDDERRLLDVARQLDGQLTATVVGDPADEIVPDLLRVLATRAGRILWDQWPTGVSVTYAQQHGGPYPATTAPSTTSVGTAAIDRFTRPVAYQGVPAHLLPPELREDATVPRRVDGTLTH